MTIIDESLYKEILLEQSLTLYDCTKGVFAYIPDFSLHTNFMPISEYNNKLKYIRGEHDYDIVKVLRGNLNPIYPDDDIHQLINIKNLQQLVKDFTVVFENGKWL